MNKTQIILFGVVLLVVLVAVFMVYSPVPKNDLDFGRMVFKGLIAGDASIDEHIDWSSVKMMGQDVAAQHATYAEPAAREVFRKALIKNIATSFAQTGGKISDFTDWRVHETRGAVVILAADYDKKDGVLLVTLTHEDGERKLIGLEWLVTSGPRAAVTESKQNEKSQ
jgi:hypothetical protein